MIDLPIEIMGKSLEQVTSATSNSTTEIILQQEKQGTEGAHGSEKIERRCCFYHMCVTVCLSSSSAGCLFLGGKRGGRVGVFGLPWEHQCLARLIFHSLLSSSSSFSCCCWMVLLACLVWYVQRSFQPPLFSLPPLLIWIPNPPIPICKSKWSLYTTQYMAVAAVVATLRSTLSSPHHTHARAYYALWFELVRESKERVPS